MMQASIVEQPVSREKSKQDEKVPVAVPASAASLASAAAPSVAKEKPEEKQDPSQLDGIEIVMLSVPSFEITSKAEVEKFVKDCIDECKDSFKDRDTFINKCLLNLLHAKKVNYPKTFEFSYKYLGHLTNVEGFVRPDERVQLLDSDGKLVVSNSDVTPMAEWQQLHYLLVHLNFLIDLYVNVYVKRQSLPDFAEQDYILAKLLREIQLTSNAFRFKVAYQTILLDGENRIGKLTNGINKFLSSLDAHWEKFDDGDVAILPIGGLGHAFYLTIVKDSPLQDEPRKHCLAHFRIDNCINENSNNHRYDGSTKIFPRLITSLPAQAGLSSYRKSEASKTPDLITYLVGICNARYNSLKGKQGAYSFVYPDEALANSLNMKIYSTEEILNYKEYYVSVPRQTTATCVVHNYKQGMQYRLKLPPDLFGWFNNLEIQRVFTSRKLPNQMSEGEKFLHKELVDMEKRYLTLTLIIKMQLQKTYLKGKFFKSFLLKDDDHKGETTTIKAVSSPLRDSHLTYAALVENYQQFIISENFLPLGLRDESEDEFIEISRLFERNDVASKKIHITGETGSGITTLCQSLSLAWSQGNYGPHDSKESQSVGTNLLSKFNLVIMIKLRDIKAGDDDFYQYIIDKFFLDCQAAKKPSGEDLKEHLDKVINETLILVDCDVIENTSPSQDKIFQQISHYPFILVVAKPEIRDKFKFDLKLITDGIPPKYIERFIAKQITNDPSSSKELSDLIITYLKSQPQIWQLAQKPLYLGIIYAFIQTNLDNFAQLPLRASDIFQWFVDKISNITPAKVTNGTLEEILKIEISPIPTIQDLIQPFLEELAFQNLFKNSRIQPCDIQRTLTKVLEKKGCRGSHFNKYHAPILFTAGNPLSCLRKINLEELDVPILETPHSFINPSFEKFFAASHIKSVLINESLREKELFLQDLHKYKYNHQMQSVLSLTAGLLYQHCELKKDFRVIELFWNELIFSSTSADLFGVFHLRLVLSCLEGCGSNSYNPALVGEGTTAIHKLILKQIIGWFEWSLQNGEGHQRFFMENCKSIKFHKSFLEAVNNKLVRRENLDALSFLLYNLYADYPADALLSPIQNILQEQGLKLKKSTSDYFQYLVERKKLPMTFSRSSSIEKMVKENEEKLPSFPDPKNLRQILTELSELKKDLSLGESELDPTSNPNFKSLLFWCCERDPEKNGLCHLLDLFKEDTGFQDVIALILSRIEDVGVFKQVLLCLIPLKGCELFFRYYFDSPNLISLNGQEMTFTLSQATPLLIGLTRTLEFESMHLEYRDCEKLKEILMKVRKEKTIEFYKAEERLIAPSNLNYQGTLFASSSLQPATLANTAPSLTHS